MKVKNMQRLAIQAFGLATVLVAVGCADPTKLVPPGPEPAPQSRVMTEGLAFRPDTVAGSDITKNPVPPGGKLWAALIQNHRFSTRPDPFALESKERAFDLQQTTERVFGETSWDRPVFYAKDDTVPAPQIEPQPYRRLAGVIVGDSILALIDMGNGQLQIIRPGQDIDGWHVVSINSDEAILRRGGNILPHEVTVRLEEPPFGSGGGGGGGGGNAGGGTIGNGGGNTGAPGIGRGPGTRGGGGAAGTPG